MTEKPTEAEKLANLLERLRHHRDDMSRIKEGTSGPSWLGPATVGPWGLIEETIDTIRALNLKVKDREATIEAINAALCNYLNNVGDEYEPVEHWNEGNKAAFEDLCKAYNYWHKNHPVVGTISMDAYLEQRAEIRREMVEALTKVLIRTQKGDDPIKTLQEQLEKWVADQ